MCDPHGVSTNPITSGFFGLLMSMMCTPSWPRSGSPSAGLAGSRYMGQSPQNAPGVV